MKMQAQRHRGTKAQSRGTRYEIVEAKFKHVGELCPRLRDCDLREIEAASARPPRVVLVNGFSLRGVAKAWLLDGRCEALFGVTSSTVDRDRGWIWLLGSGEIERHQRFVLRESREFVREMRSRFHRLENYVHAENTASIRWLEWLGFRMEAPAAFGVKRELFRHFWCNR